MGLQSVVPITVCASSSLTTPGAGTRQEQVPGTFLTALPEGCPGSSSNYSTGNNALCCPQSAQEKETIENPNKQGFVVLDKKHFHQLLL